MIYEVDLDYEVLTQNDWVIKLILRAILRFGLVQRVIMDATCPFFSRICENAIFRYVPGLTEVDCRFALRDINLCTRKLT